MEPNVFLTFFRYWKVKLMMRLGPNIDVPLEWNSWVKKTVARAAERQSSIEAWEEIRQAQRQGETGAIPSVPKDCR